MMVVANNNNRVMSDVALLKVIGAFVKHHRLNQNKSQIKLATEAGISRFTLSDFEKGKRSNTITLIQILRALDQLSILDNFKIEQQLSPIQLAEIESSQRKRASKSKKTKSKTKSNW